MRLLRTAAHTAVAAHTVSRVQQRNAAKQQRAAAAAPVASPAPAPASPAPAPAPTAPVAPDTGAMLEQLRQLGELRAAGVLTDAEFEAQKARILAS
ncbi:MAG: SHOCT domain-containing protein [Tessaracoccus sp.]|uniref:SHOCT domain-containing protein n=1 Tax=Tessaracoccus sp. TaxID=1971211 RepID=UPI001ED2FD32|nr:SHOCT domain-containing protein [Tessaracoccus sp.]MBK7821984.1 SHOCT domain-containing protein [Tessaracoccus sp.]